MDRWKKVSQVEVCSDGSESERKPSTLPKRGDLPPGRVLPVGPEVSPTFPRGVTLCRPAGSELVHATMPGHTVFTYVIEGKACFCQQKNLFAYEVEGENYFDLRREALAANHSLVLFDDGDQLVVSTEGESTRFLLLAGKPIGEPVAWYGPIVMNTAEELEVAFEEYEKGTFVANPK